MTQSLGSEDYLAVYARNHASESTASIGKKRIMWARKLTNELLVAGPFLMLAIMAIKSRTNYDPWETPGNPAEVESRIDAYVKPMKVLNQALEGRDDAKIRLVARDWLDRHLKGELRPLPPCSYVDSTREGVKGQITLAKNRLVYRLIEQSEAAQSKGDSKASVSDALLAYKVADVLKYSDFSTVYDTARAQMRIFATLEKALKDAAPDQKKWVRLTLDKPGLDVKSLNRILLQARNMYTASLRAKGQQSLPIEDTQQFAQIGTALHRRCDSESLQGVRKLIVASNGDMPRILTTAKLAWQMESMRDAKAKALLSSF